MDNGSETFYNVLAGTAEFPSFSNAATFCQFLLTAQQRMQEAIVGLAASAAFPVRPELASEANVRGFRTLLSKWLIGFAEKLGPDSGDSRRTIGGWTRLTFTYRCMLQCHALLLVLPGSRTRQAILAYDAGTSRYLTRNNLVCWPGRGATAMLSMSQLGLAIDVFRSRLDSLDGLDADMYLYISALESRTAALALGVGLCLSQADYDVLAWVDVPPAPPEGSDQPKDKTRTPSVIFLNTSCWWFVWLRRYIYSHTRITDGSFWPVFPSRHNGGCCSEDGSGQGHRFRDNGDDIMLQHVPCPKIIGIVRKYADTLRTDEHRRAWRDHLAKSFEVFPGDYELFASRGGAVAEELPTVRAVIDVMRTSNQAIFSAFTRYERPLADWLVAAEQRCKLEDMAMVAGTCSGPGAPWPLLFEQLAFIHCLDALFISKWQVPWRRNYVIFQRVGHMRFAVAAMEAVRAGRPFLVQRFGRWACCVPQPSSATSLEVDDDRFTRPIDWPSLELAVLQRIGTSAAKKSIAAAAARRHDRHDRGLNVEQVQVWEAPHIYEAAELWCAALLDGPWQGKAHGDRDCTPFLASIFAF